MSLDHRCTVCIDVSAGDDTHVVVHGSFLVLCVTCTFRWLLMPAHIQDNPLMIPKVLKLVNMFRHVQTCQPY